MAEFGRDRHPGRKRGVARASSSGRLLASGTRSDAADQDNVVPLKSARRPDHRGELADLLE
ncbi:MAG: hypothetical protein F4W90_05715 [Gammaproteobacteria bacterium]|nr:hypothetical protein [Gammaproteobacteria bacterium]